MGSASARNAGMRSLSRNSSKMDSAVDSWSSLSVRKSRTGRDSALRTAIVAYSTVVDSRATSETVSLGYYYTRV